MDLISQERTGIEKKFYEICEKVVHENGLKIYDFEYAARSQTLRVFLIDENTNTATIDDCAKIDSALSPYFETEEWIPENIMLEVSSPGVFRELNMHWHFERVLGKRIAVKLKKPLTSETLPRFLKGEKKLVGILESISESHLRLIIRDETLNVEWNDIKKANLEPEI